MDEIDQLIKPMILQDLRIQLRARGVNPAGGAAELKERLKENMIQTGNFSLNFQSGVVAPTPAAAGASTANVREGSQSNNYSRPEGQNVGNFLTDRNSSRVLAPPGGISQISFGGEDLAPAQTNYQFTGIQQQPLQPVSQQPYTGAVAPYGIQDGPTTYGASSNAVRDGGSLSNNYSRPGGQQNVGNFLTDRNSSRVLAPPGGKSQITFG